MITKELLDILCCPLSHADLVYDENTLVSTDEKTRRRYKIEDDIPIMLIDESEELDLDIWKAIMIKHNIIKE
ncbi:MAG: Trm112 family protein [bacterium]